MDVAIVLGVLLAPYVGCLASIAATGLHTAQEVLDDGAPIWRYLRLPVPDAAGAAGLIAFAGVQAALAVDGYVCGSRPALWFLLGARAADCAVSHWLPWLAGRRPNPGLTTTPYYALESLVIGLVLGGVR